jgi:hypothetical protein
MRIIILLLPSFLAFAWVLWFCVQARWNEVIVPNWHWVVLFVLVGTACLGFIPHLIKRKWAEHKAAKLAEEEAQRKAEEKRRVKEAQEAEIEKQRKMEEEKKEEEERIWREALAEHPTKMYECYGCGKTELGKDLDILYESNRSQSWYVEWFDGLHRIYQVPLPQPFITIERMYCSKCGKARVRELELMNIELQKIKAINRQADDAKWRAERIEERLEEQNRLMRRQIETAEKLASIEEDRLREEKYSRDM